MIPDASLNTRRPPHACPKCGYAFGFYGVRPTYIPDRIDDHLEWSCSNCGYTISTPTADAEPER